MSIYIHAKSRAEYVLDVGDGATGPVLHKEPRRALTDVARTARDPPLSLEELNPSVDLLGRTVDAKCNIAKLLANSIIYRYICSEDLQLLEGLLGGSSLSAFWKSGEKGYLEVEGLKQLTSMGNLVLCCGSDGAVMNSTDLELQECLCAQYPWSPVDSVDMQYFNISEQRLLPLTCDELLETFFALNAGSRFGKIHIDVLQPHKAGNKGKSVKASSGGRVSSGVQTSCVSDVSANSVQPRPPCRSTVVPSIPTTSVSQTAPAADVEEDAEPDEAVPRLDDEDELMFPKLVDRFSQHAMEDVYTEELSRPARFDDTDDEEKEENNDSLSCSRLQW
ncbi:hypothetical protein ACQ4PT_027760 [Festuca glaucescens]